MTQEDSQYWLDILQSGDRRGVQQMYDRFLPAITKHITTNQGNDEDALDVFQEAILIIYKKMNNGEGLTLTASFFTYLFAICKKLWLKKLEKRKKIRVTNYETPELRDEDNWEEVIQEEERFRLFRAKFRELSENCQQLLSLFFKKTPMTEIVEIMGYASVQYAKKRKFQCKEKLVELVQNDAAYNSLI